MARTGGDPRGKLRRLASAWASGRSLKRDNSGREVVEAEKPEEPARELTEWEKDCARFGIAPDAFNDGHRQDDRDTIPLWPDMRPAFALFCDASWNWVSLGQAGAIRTNISRVELEASARGLGIELTPEIYTDVRAMEGEAVAYWSRKR